MSNSLLANLETTFNAHLESSHQYSGNSKAVAAAEAVLQKYLDTHVNSSSVPLAEIEAAFAEDGSCHFLVEEGRGMKTLYTAFELLHQLKYTSVTSNVFNAAVMTAGSMFGTLGDARGRYLEAAIWKALLSNSNAGSGSDATAAKAILAQYRTYLTKNEIASLNAAATAAANSLLAKHKKLMAINFVAGSDPLGDIMIQCLEQNGDSLDWTPVTINIEIKWQSNKNAAVKWFTLSDAHLMKETVLQHAFRQMVPTDNENGSALWTKDMSLHDAQWVSNIYQYSMLKYFEDAGVYDGDAATFFQYLVQKGEAIGFDFNLNRSRYHQKDVINVYNIRPNKAGVNVELICDVAAAIENQIAASGIQIVQQPTGLRFETADSSKKYLGSLRPLKSTISPYAGHKGSQRKLPLREKTIDYTLLLQLRSLS